MTTPRLISIMGSTGSIGCSALSVIEHANNGEETDAIFAIDVLAAGSDVEKLADQAIQFHPALAVIADESKLPELQARLAHTNIGTAGGHAAVTEAAARPCDRLLAAIVGSAGLSSTLSALAVGTDVALANKESIVCAGPLMLAQAEKSGAHILPVDSEHNAIFQVFLDRASIERLTITASGGPFLNNTIEEMRVATPDQAKAHPNWNMGIKNSIDSATLMNKALEFIEAAYLFDMPAEKIDVLVHPQSIVHGMAHYKDGSVLAQMSAPDMCTPIAHALAWPERIETNVDRLDLAALSRLDFLPVDEAKFPAIRLAKQALALGPGGPTVLNCANEAAVTAYIAGECGFLDISWVVEETLTRFSSGQFGDGSYESLEEIAELDKQGRDVARNLLQQSRNRGGGKSS